MQLRSADVFMLLGDEGYMQVSQLVERNCGRFHAAIRPDESPTGWHAIDVVVASATMADGDLIRGIETAMAARTRGLSLLVIPDEVEGPQPARRGSLDIMRFNGDSEGGDLLTALLFAVARSHHHPNQATLTEGRRFVEAVD